VKWGQLRLRTLALTLPDSMEVKAVRVLVNERPVKHQFSTSRNRLTLSLAEDLQLKAKSKLQVHVA
jgi:hypothetical protein